MKNKLVILFLLIRVVGSGQIDSTGFIVEKIMKEQKIVGLSLAVIRNGKPAINKGYGLANAEHNIPVTPETVIRLGLTSTLF